MVEIASWADIDADLLCLALTGIFNLVSKFLICILLHLSQFGEINQNLRHFNLVKTLNIYVEGLGEQTCSPGYIIGDKISIPQVWLKLCTSEIIYKIKIVTGIRCYVQNIDIEKSGWNILEERYLMQRSSRAFLYISGRYPSLLRKSPLFVRDYDKCETIRHFNYN